MKIVDHIYNIISNCNKSSSRYSINLLSDNVLKNKIKGSNSLSEIMNTPVSKSICEDDLINFIINLIKMDPDGNTLKEQSKDYPITYIDPEFTEKPPYDLVKRDRIVRPKCNSCKEMAYFGLPFCPHCLKPMPPFYPTKGNRPIYSNTRSIYPLYIVDNTIPTLAAASSTKVFYQDDDITVSEMEIAAVKADINKYIPR